MLTKLKAASDLAADIVASAVSGLCRCVCAALDCVLLPPALVSACIPLVYFEYSVQIVARVRVQRFKSVNFDR